MLAVAVSTAEAFAQLLRLWLTHLYASLASKYLPLTEVKYVYKFISSLFFESFFDVSCQTVASYRPYLRAPSVA